MKLCFLILCFIASVGLLLGSGIAKADSLASFTINAQAGSAVMDGSGVQFLLYATPETSPNYDGTATLFSGNYYIATDIGKTFTATAADAGFAGFVSRITDGVQDSLQWEMGAINFGYGLSGTADTTAIWGNINDPRIDLHGYVIDSIDLKINSITATVKPISLPYYPRGWTDYTFRGTVSFDGHLAPLPSSAWAGLALVGCLGAFKASRRVAAVLQSAGHD